MNTPVPAKPINQVAVGDVVAVPNRNSDIRYALLTVERLTATQFVTTFDRRFRIDDGKEINGRSSYVRAVIATPEFIAELKAESARIIEEIALRSRLHSIASDLTRLPIDAVRAMVAAYDATENARLQSEAKMIFG